ncbi:CotS family spore coat protein [Paenibacillus qinlingensis]|uniref:CotS family spore coat protein n=1 Tax=Paenibacillus qinlingensis TaxID=1837343 RepID=A0ABU1NUH9_9BACL|nr:CotS family spore coat protein [Paenibacillus qinlingensis]MDR6551142.1 CotS family spore coat protein [Paenibacillus qinlingensis]
MDNYQVVPWINDVLDPGIVANMYVPPGLENLAREVLGNYDLQLHDMLLITSKPDKGGAIWKIGTSKGNLSIKCLHRRPRRSLFSVGAQAYMSGLGYRVPSFIPTKEGHMYVEAGGKLWIVTDWIEPLVPVSKVDLEGASQLCFGLGEFHKNSKGYVPPSGSEKSSRIFGWGKYYEKIIAKINWFQDIANAYSDTAGSADLLAVIEEFKRQANEMYLRFQNSPYNQMLAKGEPHWGLAHQDFGWSNGQMGPGGIWVIDLDGVSYDLPIRDLRKLITSTMDDMGVWDITWIRGMIEAYHQANPIDQETFEILWIDMAFPNEFYKHVKEIVFNPQVFLDTELAPILQRVMTTEASKWQALSELEKDKANYPAGEYSSDYVKPIVQSPIVVPGELLTPIYSDMPDLVAATPIMEPIAANPITEPIYSDMPDKVAADPILEPIYSDMPEMVDTTPIMEPIYSDTPDVVAAKPIMEPIYSDTPVKRDKLKVPSFQEPIYSDAPAREPLESAQEIPQVPAVIPFLTDPGIAPISLPPQEQTRFTLRVPKKRRARRKTKIIKKTRYLYRRKRRRLAKWKYASGAKLIKSSKKWRTKKKLRPLLRSKKKQLKRSSGAKKPIKQLTKPYLKKMVIPRNDQKASQPLKKRQIQPRRRTA